MNQKRNGGYSLIEIMIAIAILGLILVPTCTSLVMSIRINERTDEMLQAQLAVSSAVEILMAEGISGANSDDYGWTEVEQEDESGNKVKVLEDRFPEVKIVTEEVAANGGGTEPFYKVVVSKIVTTDEGERELLSVTTHIRKAGGTP